MVWITKTPPAPEKHFCAVPSTSDAGEKSVWQCDECGVRWVLLNRPTESNGVCLVWCREGGWWKALRTGIMPWEGKQTRADV